MQKALLHTYSVSAPDAVAYDHKLRVGDPIC